MLIYKFVHNETESLAHRYIEKTLISKLTQKFNNFFT